MCLCLLLAMLFSCLQLALLFSFFCTCLLPCCWEMLFCSFARVRPCRWECSFHPLWVRSFDFFSPASSNLAILPKLLTSVGAVFAPRRRVDFSWSCVRSTASLRDGVAARSSLRLRTTLFHVLRVDLVVSAPHTPPLPRAVRVEGVFPEVVCSGSSKQLQHCLSPRIVRSRFSARQLHFVVFYRAVLTDSSSGTSDTTT